MSLPLHEGDITSQQAGNNPSIEAPFLGTTNPSTEGPRLHKPGVAGSSPAAATGNASLQFNESITAYHSDREWWSKSQLWDLWANGPLYFHGRYISGGINSPFGAPLVKGTRVHEWAEQGDEAWWSRVVEIPKTALGKDGRSTKATEEFISQALADKPDAICLGSDEISEFRDQFRQMLDNPVFARLQDQTEHREFSVRGIDPETGLQIRCRPDAAGCDFLWDIKTTKERRPLKTFWKSVVDYGYAMQAVLYLQLCRQAGIEAKQFIFLVTSTVQPYECHAVTLPEALLDQARRDLKSVCMDLQTRLLFDHWSPADVGQITELVFPNWILKEAKRNGHGSRNHWGE